MEIPELDYWTYLMTAEQRRHYEKQVVESEGFDVDYFPIEAGNLIRPVILMDDDEKKDVLFLTEKAVELYNSENPSNQIKNPRIVKANYWDTGFIIYYITFTAKDAATGKRRTYQTKVDAKLRVEDSMFLFCRLKPKKAQRPKYSAKQVKYSKPDPGHQAEDALEGELVAQIRDEEAVNPSEERNKEEEVPEENEIDMLKVEKKKNERKRKRKRNRVGGRLRLSAMRS